MDAYASKSEEVILETGGLPVEIAGADRTLKEEPSQSKKKHPCLTGAGSSFQGQPEEREKAVQGKKRTGK